MDILHFINFFSTTSVEASSKGKVTDSEIRTIKDFFRNPKNADLIELLRDSSIIARRLILSPQGKELCIKHRQEKTTQEKKEASQSEKDLGNYIKVGLKKSIPQLSTFSWIIPDDYLGPTI